MAQENSHVCEGEPPTLCHLTGASTHHLQRISLIHGSVWLAINCVAPCAPLDATICVLEARTPDSSTMCSILRTLHSAHLCYQINNVMHVSDGFSSLCVQGLWQGESCILWFVGCVCFVVKQLSSSVPMVGICSMEPSTWCWVLWCDERILSHVPPLVRIILASICM